MFDHIVNYIKDADAREAAREEIKFWCAVWFGVGTGTTLVLFSLVVTYGR